MRKRDETSAPNIGAYVMIQGGKDAKGYEKSEDPLFALKNNLPLDTQHYIDHQFKKPLKRIFKHILTNAFATLFCNCLI